jgi:hypothetical protein
MERHSSRLEQAENRISELEDEMEMKGKNELLLKQLKTCEFTNPFKRPNLRIMSIEEGEEEEAIHNVFNVILTEKFLNLEKTMPIQVQEASRIPSRLDQNRTTPQHIIIKTTSTETRERILKAVRGRKQITYKGKPIKITADFSTEILKGRIAWNEVFRALNEITSTIGYSVQQKYHSK